MTQKPRGSRSTLLLLPLGLLLAMVAGSAQAGPDQDLYARGRDAVFAERWDDARKALEDLIRRHPDSQHADDAHYWLGMALYESHEPDRAYGILKQMQERFPESPWNDDGRVLMVRCAEAALLAAPRSASPDRPAQGTASVAEYEAFLQKSTRDSSSKVQLLAIDTVLGTRPEMAAELLPRLSSGRAPREATGIVLDRFFGGAQVKVLMERPSLGFTEGNVAVMVRTGDKVEHLGLNEALELAGPAGRASKRFEPDVRNELGEKLVEAERTLIEPAGPGTIETTDNGLSRSAIIKVVDGEVHYYRNGEETSRIVVLNRQAGFSPRNVRVFVESPSGMRELPLDEARRLKAGGGEGLGEPTVRYLKAALAIIEIDLTRIPGAPAGSGN
ncbi:MAG: tetratricopeptide repeat protein [Candidatus Polarisedimenticolia bacterium]